MDPEGLALERDEQLIRRLAQRADDLRMYLREWIQAELKEARIQLEITAINVRGPLEPSVNDALARVIDLDGRELKELDASFLEHIQSTRDLPFDDLAKICEYLDDGNAGMVRTVRELLTIRRLLATTTSSESP